MSSKGTFLKHKSGAFGGLRGKRELAKRSPEAALDACDAQLEGASEETSNGAVADAEGARPARPQRESSY